jgi:hypothetical protein
MSVGADVLLVSHIAGGTVAIIAGTVALLARKGEHLHRTAGTLFFIGMLVCTGIGAVVSPFLTDGQRANTLAGVLTFYLVLTAWTTVRARDAMGGRFAIAGLLVALAGGLTSLLFIFQAQASPTGTLDDAPPQAFTIFLIIGLVAAAGDLNVILRGGISGAPRIARHLWRMCVGLFVASGSFFLGQQPIMPAWLRGSPLLFLPVVLPIVLMVFWLIRVRLTKWMSRRATAPRTLAPSVQWQGKPFE